MRVVMVVLVAAAFGLAACGGDQPDVEAGSETTTTTTIAESTTTIGAVPVTGAIDLTVTVVSEGAPLRDATITCAPEAETPTGTGYLAEASAAQAACDLLRTNPWAVTLLVNGRDPGLMCTQQYGGPEEATVKGTIDGQRVNASINRRDGCGIAEWNLLTPLLGSPAT
jgi:hypothetical protein